MRAPLVSLLALAAAGAAFAQAPVNPPATAPAAVAPATSPAPLPGAAAAGPLATPNPNPAPAEPAPAPAATPPAPPPAPTDPTAIAVINTLETVCAPAVNGGKLDQLTRAAGFRKSGENYVKKGANFQLTVLAAGSNPDTCHIDVIHPVDPEAPAKPLVVALHNWAAVSRGYTLYRNDKNTASGQELTTRSWENTENGKSEALVLTTFRKADGTPLMRDRDTSQVLFSVSPAPAAAPPAAAPSN